MPEPTKEQLKEVEELMQNPDIAAASGLVLAAWRLYFLARENMIAVSKNKINNSNFHIVSQALSQSACAGFKVGRFKNHIKNTVLPFLKRLSIKEATVEKVHGRPPSDPREPEGDETSCNP